MIARRLRDVEPAPSHPRQVKTRKAAAVLGDPSTARRAITSAGEAMEREHRDELLEIGGEFRLSRATLHYLAGSAIVEIPQALTEATGELERAAELYTAGPEPGEDRTEE